MRKIEKRSDKRAQQLTLGTIILIVLGIAVLVFLIFGFSTGWNQLWSKVTEFGGTNNVDTVRQACALACSAGNTFAYCNEGRTVNYGDKVTQKGSCWDFYNDLDNGPGIDSCSSARCGDSKQIDRGDGEVVGDRGAESDEEKAKRLAAEAEAARVAAAEAAADLEDN